MRRLSNTSAWFTTKSGVAASPVTPSLSFITRYGGAGRGERRDLETNHTTVCIFLSQKLDKSSFDIEALLSNQRWKLREFLCSLY